MDSWINKNINYAKKVFSSKKKDKCNKLYESYNGNLFDNIYSWPIPLKRVEIPPNRPFVAKVPMKMEFIDQDGCAYYFNKEKGKLESAYIVLINSMQGEFIK